jgi:hypothetical protein
MSDTIIDPPWQNLPENLDKDAHYAFVYLITNTVTGKKYIGKKQFWSRIKRKPLKGKKRNRIDHVKSDYETYYGSSNKLKEDIEKYGKQSFTRQILAICGSKWEVAYAELYYQMKENVIFRDDYYNEIINVRLNNPPKNVDLSSKYSM